MTTNHAPSAHLTDEQIAYIVGATTAAAQEAAGSLAADHAVVKDTVAGALDALAILHHQLLLARGADVAR